MLNRYAIISPAYTFGSDSLGDMSSLFITSLHKCKYEKICGYSLGHEPVFFDSLQAAQQEFAHHNSLLSLQMRQMAIVEFQVSNDSVINFTKLFEVKNIERKYQYFEKNQKTFFKRINIPAWNERDILDTDLSAKALVEFNKFYEMNIKNKINREHRLINS